MKTNDGAFRYQIIDEPRENLLNRLAMPPEILFLVLMVFWPWGIAVFLVNSFALNAPSKWREVGLCAASFAAVLGMSVALGGTFAISDLDRSFIPYIRVFVIAVSLWIAYYIYTAQAASYELRKYLRALRQRS